jgi:hypothetical protein
MTRPIESPSDVRASDLESDGPAARWSLERGWFYWTVITIIDPIVALSAAWLWLRARRKS